MRNKILIFCLMIGLLISLTACDGLGSLKVRVVNLKDQPADDVYVGIYTENFNRRIKFGYTTRGTVQFQGLNSGNYGLKIVGLQESRQTKIRIKSRQTTQVQIHLGD